MRASGIPAQYVAGHAVVRPGPAAHPLDVPGQLSDGGLHPGRHADLGPGGRSQLADRDGEPLLVPVQRRQRLGERRPADARGPVGQTFTAATGTFTEVPQSLRQTTEVQLTAEIYSQADAAFGLAATACTENVVLDQTFNDVDSGGPAALGREFRQSDGDRRHFLGITNTYTPYIFVATRPIPMRAMTDSSGHPVPRGLTQLPLGQPGPHGAVLEHHTGRPRWSVRRPTSQTIWTPLVTPPGKATVGFRYRRPQRRPADHLAMAT